MTKGNRIKMLREKVGLSQVDLADRIGVSKQSLYKYENDIITNIPSDKIEAIACETHSTPAYIMGWIDNDHDLAPNEQPHCDTTSLRPDESQLLTYYNDLNDTGKDQAMVQVMNLTQIPAYTDKGELSYSSEAV